MKGKYPIQTRQAVFNEWLKREPLKTISERFNVPINTIKMWVSVHKWAVQRDEYEEQQEANFKFRNKKLLMDNRLRVVSKHFKLADQMHVHLDKALTKKGKDGKLVDYTPSQLNDLARAAKSTSEIDGKAAGISDKTDPLLAPEAQGGMIGTGLIINVGGAPSLIKKATGIIEERPAEPPPFA